MSVKPRRNVLISSAGRRVSLLRAFEKAAVDLDPAIRVLAADASTLSAAWHASGQGHLVPRCTAPDFVPALLALCRTENIGLIVPTIDTELQVLADARAQFEAEGTIVAVSSPETVAIGGDKVRTHGWLVEHGFPTATQVAAANAHEMPAGPCIAKPRRGSASIGVQVLRSPNEAAHLDPDGDYVLQSIAAGDEFTVDVFVLNGRCLSAVPRQRLEIRAGEVSKGVTRRQPAVEKLAAGIAEHLPGAFGVLNIQLFFEERSNTLSVIEINPRFGGGYPLSHSAGVDFPRWLMEHASGRPPSAHNDWRNDLVMLRYDDAVFVDAAATDL